MTPPGKGHGAFVVRHGDQGYRVETGDDGTARVEPGGDVLRVDRVEPDTYRVTADGASWRVVVHAAGDQRQVFVDGSVFEFEVGSGLKPRPPRARPDELAAPMPARVREVLVRVGQEVATGEILVTLEAMKMELAVRAPRAGTVVSIACREGELVPQGVPLLQLEAASGLEGRT
ncbi:MAG TPA: biotin/lipoyl-containing protein [Vicinamibacterales bacterium]|nr:biotin/lipoyl-containing protein [Vicinamibacterales bacterium]